MKSAKLLSFLFSQTMPDIPNNSKAAKYKPLLSDIFVRFNQNRQDFRLSNLFVKWSQRKAQINLAPCWSTPSLNQPVLNATVKKYYSPAILRKSRPNQTLL